MLDLAEPPTEAEVPSDPSVLAPVAVAVERERQRLGATAGRGPIVAFLVRAALRVRHLGTDDAAQSGRRYVPVIWTVIGVVVLSALLPGRLHVLAPTEQPALADPVSTPTTVPPTPVTTTVADPVIPPVEDVPIVAPPDEGVPYTPPSTPPTIPTDDFVPTPGSTGGVLYVTSFGWASSLAGTPLASQGVPDGTMPVGNRIGRLDKATFVRLSGSSSTVTLTENTAGTRESLGTAAIVACPILSGDWQAKPAQSFDSSPTWATKGCVSATRKGTTWTFDLTAFADRTGQNGFALVPAANAPADFQIAFKPASS